MKKILFLFTGLSLLLSGCGLIAERAVTTPDPAQEAAYVYTEDSFPALSAGPSLQPMAEALASIFLGQPRESVGDYLTFGETKYIWDNLYSEDADLILAAARRDFDEHFDDYSAQFDIAAIALDGIVFYVSEENPVDSLTTAQLKQIFEGKIENWSELGGDDVPMKAVTRSPFSGSQAAVESLLMDGTLVVPTYDNEDNAFDGGAGDITFGFYHYAKVMQMAEGFKIISVDGVEPSTEAISSGDYPLITQYYAAIAADAEEGSPERIMWDWLQGSRGQNFIASIGYVPAGR